MGLARGCIRHREFPSLILHKLHIKLLQHLFFLLLPDLHSLNKGGDLYGKGMRSVSPHVVPWVSHHHMIPVMELKMLTDPVLPICSSWRALGRHLKDGHTTQHAGLTAEEQGWYIWKRIKRASRGRQYIKEKGRQGSHMLVEREECCPEDHKQRNNLSLLPLSFLLAETDGLESD